MTTSPTIRPFGQAAPEIDPSVWLAPGAVVVGDVAIGADSAVFYNAVLRGDCAAITIGQRTNLQDSVVVHVDDAFPTVVGNDVSVGHAAVLHGCTIGDGCLIGMSSTVMSGAVVEPGAMVAAGALVTPGKVVPSGMLAAGVPAKIIRELTEAEKAHLRHNAAHYLDLAATHRAADPVTEA